MKIVTTGEVRGYYKDADNNGRMIVIIHCELSKSLKIGSKVGVAINVPKKNLKSKEGNQQ
jgi:hypothetical protein